MIAIPNPVPAGAANTFAHAPQVAQPETALILHHLEHLQATVESISQKLAVPAHADIYQLNEVWFRNLPRSFVNYFYQSRMRKLARQAVQLYVYPSEQMQEFILLNQVRKTKPDESEETFHSWYIYNKGKVFNQFTRVFFFVPWFLIGSNR